MCTKETQPQMGDKHKREGRTEGRTKYDLRVNKYSAIES